MNSKQKWERTHLISKVLKHSVTDGPLTENWPSSSFGSVFSCTIYEVMHEMMALSYSPFCKGHELAATEKREATSLNGA